VGSFAESKKRQPNFIIAVREKRRLFRDRIRWERLRPRDPQRMRAGSALLKFQNRINFRFMDKGLLEHPIKNLKNTGRHIQN
jgi:hypothetical protein